MQTASLQTPVAELDAQLRAFIGNPQFPCVGAKSACATGGLRVLGARDICRDDDDAEIHRVVEDWGALHRDAGKRFFSLAVVFAEPHRLSEIAFEQALWARLQALADIDARRGKHLDRSVAANPDSADFALSLGESAFFVVGLHPNSARPARQFAYPTMIFNLHVQFVRLREQHLYDKMRNQIMKRDIALAGSANPMLADHGDRSAARQYSGRAVSEDWVCPFHDPRA